MNAIHIERWRLWCALLVQTIVESFPVAAEIHRDLVYQRYGRALMANQIPYEFDMTFAELGHPATKQDVETGAAVFTFEGLGPSRVWTLPKCPNFAEWPALRDYPRQDEAGKTQFDDTGYVCQAEELNIGGQWKRYFGFVSERGAAVVPAEDIYLWLAGCGSVSEASWVQLPNGVDWGMLGPLTELEPDPPVLPTFNLGAPLQIELLLRNRRGTPQHVLGDIYRDAKNGGPAFRRGVTLLLGWAPYNPKSPDRRYPRLEDFTRVPPIHTNDFASIRTGPLLETGDSTQVASFDLRDWFAVKTPGHYHYHFAFDPGVLGLSTNEGFGPQTYIGFKVGPEPRHATVEEINQGIPAFGGNGRAEYLEELIQRSLAADDQTDHSQPSLGTLPQLNQAYPSEFERLLRANRGFLQELRVKSRDLQRATLEALMEREFELPMRLMLASEAAPLGSRRAALFLLKCMHNTDYHVAGNTHEALRHALYRCKTNPPVWLQELAMAALADERIVARTSSDVSPTMSYLADEHAGLAEALGYTRGTNAVTFLIEMTQKTNGRRGSVIALGNLGDPRAIPVLLGLVQQRGPSLKRDKGRVMDDGFARPIAALGQLRAAEAVPVLLEYIEHPEVIESLEAIGDARAIGPLQKIVAANGNRETPSDSTDPELTQRRLAAARIALASLEPGDRTARLCELLTEPSFDQFQRRSVVWRLGDRPDPRAIPFLAKAIQTDPSGGVVNQAVTVLAVFKYKAAVDALIDSLDADFAGKSDWKRAYTPEMFRVNIADALTKLTQQNIVADKELWLNWWKANRNTISGLK